MVHAAVMRTNEWQQIETDEQAAILGPRPVLAAGRLSFPVMVVSRRVSDCVSPSYWFVRFLGILRACGRGDGTIFASISCQIGTEKRA